MVAHAREDLPNECCGMIGGRDGEATRVVRVENAAASPLRYEMDPQGQYNALKAIEDAGEELVCDLPLAHRAAPPIRRRPTSTRRWMWPEQVYVIVSLENGDAPDVKAFRPGGLKIAEVELDLAYAAGQRPPAGRPRRRRRRGRGDEGGGGGGGGGGDLVKVAFARNRSRRRCCRGCSPGRHPQRAEAQPRLRRSLTSSPAALAT